MDKTYSQYSVGQARANQAAQQLLTAAVKDILSGPSASTGPFCVADIGSSIGNNSILELATVVRCLNEQGAEDREVSITHVDQLSNHWDQLFAALTSTSNGYPKARTLGQGAPIYSYALARDMYQQCFPSGSLDLVYSGITLHWGSSAVNAPDHITAQYSSDEETRRAGEKQGQQDLVQWLRVRAKELRPGGHLIATAGGSHNEAGSVAIRKTFDVINTCWHQMVSDGRLTKAEYESTCFPLYFSNLKECLTLVTQELSNQFEVLQTTGGAESVSKVGSQHSAVPNEDECEVASETFLAALRPGFRQVISQRPQGEQDDILQSLKQAMKQEYLASNFVPPVQYILLALRRR